MSARFTRIPAAMREVSYHAVPERALTARLDGSVAYERSDGEVGLVPAGGFVLVEDTRANGHTSLFHREVIVFWFTLLNGLDLPSG
jgi:hypothetical protein